MDNNNKKEKLSVTKIIFTLLLMNIAVLLTARFAGGSGRAEDPWQIATAQHLNNVRHYLGEEHRNKHFIQIEDIDLYDATREGGAYWNNGNGWLPIGNTGHGFYGVYNGKGYHISGLYIRQTTDFIGLFGYIWYGKIQNVSLVNVYVNVQRDRTGALAGVARGAIIKNCYSTGTVSGSFWVGGLIGTIGSDTLISDSYSTADVTGSRFTGGLIGSSNDAEIVNCFSTGTVSGRITVGGLVGSNGEYSTLRNCFSTGNVSGTDNVGGLVGSSGRTSFFPVIENCYSTGDVSGRHHTGANVGGLVGYIDRATIRNSYSTGRVSGGEGVGGLVGVNNNNSPVVNSYWNTYTSGQTSSSGGEGRVTQDMTYRYSDNTYIFWNFQGTWSPDADYSVNDGYPYFKWQHNRKPNPAVKPVPYSNSSEISVTIEELRWTHRVDPRYAQPAGFRVYFGNQAHFCEEDDFVWVPYEINRTEYSVSEVLPSRLSYYTVYYWKVVPTTSNPDDEDRTGGDAQDVLIWEFRTESHPHPDVAFHPRPVDKADNIPISLESLSWSYISSPLFTDPVGFRVYLNTTGEFDEDSIYEWVWYNHQSTNFVCTQILPDILELSATYYWKVVPTTVNPDDEDRTGGDAQDVLIWEFRTESHTHPDVAFYPRPVDKADNIPISLESLSWSYISSPLFTDPVGFRVYLNTTGEFDEDSIYEWVWYNHQNTNFVCTQILPDILELSATYYWKVVPTTETSQTLLSEHFAEKTQPTVLTAKTKNSKNQHYGDAQDIPIWSFTTISAVDIESHNALYTTKLNNNYPNPFNPETTISFSIAEDGEVMLDIINIRGQSIIKLINDHLETGYYSVRWNGRDEKDKPVSSGVYFLRMKTGNYTEIKRMMMLR